jgi:uncharacterized membrane protein
MNKTLLGLLLVFLLGTASAQPTPNGDVYVVNSCAHPVQLAVSWEDPLDGWRTEGWWEFAASTPAPQSLTAGDGQVRTANGFLYIYAETTDGSGVVWEADNEDFREVIDGQSYDMLELEMDAEDDGSWILSLACEGL